MILGALVFQYAVGAFALGPLVEHVALALVVVEGNGESAGFGYAGDVDSNDGARADVFWKKLFEGFEIGMVRGSKRLQGTGY